MENQKAFIATTNYIRKVKLPFGVGVITSFTEEDAMNLTIRRRHLETRNEWFDIEIPDRSSFLNLDNLLEENPQECLDSLFSTKALSFLFYDEGQRLFKQMPELIESKTSVQEEKNILAQKELKNFYDSKADELKKLMSVYSLIQFITDKARGKDMAITSSFLSMIGINGIIYSEDNNERALILQGRVTYPDACVAIKGYVRCVNPAKERYLERLRRGSFIFLDTFFQIFSITS